MNLIFLNCFRSVKGRIFYFSQSARNPSYNLENIGVREIGRTLSKLGFPSFFSKGLMKPYFQICGCWPDSGISLKITNKGFEKKSLKALIRGNGISKGQTLVFPSFPIFILI